MDSGKKVRDIMVGIFDYPHVPYWFSIAQAVKIIGASFLGNKKVPEPMAVLVFDEKYSLMGIITMKEILKGLEPKFLKPVEKTQMPQDNRTDLSLVWDTLFSKELKMLAEKPVNEIMTPVRDFVDPDDPVEKAAYIILENDLVLLPVLEDRRRFLGLVRLIEVFDYISGRL